MIHPLLSIQAHSQTFILHHFKHTHYGRYMKKIHNSHLGESCFVIGNGPSLTAEDLTTLHEKGIDTFAVNRIFKIFPQTEWRPTYYVSTDAVLVRDILDDVNAMPVKLPVYFMSGDRDPVGQMGKGVLEVAAQFRQAGLTDVSVHLYDGARHELFNETNRDEVLHELTVWLDEHFR